MKAGDIVVDHSLHWPSPDAHQPVSERLGHTGPTCLNKLLNTLRNKLTENTKYMYDRWIFVDHQSLRRFPRYPQLENSLHLMSVSRGPSKLWRPRGTCSPSASYCLRCSDPEAPAHGRQGLHLLLLLLCERRGPAPCPSFAQLVPMNTDIHSDVRILFL